MLYVFLAKGFEEIEALTPVDILRRGGVEVVTVGVGGREIEGSHHITVLADIAASELKSLDGTEGVVLPGGMPGTRNLEKNKTVINTVTYCAERKLVIGAICAAPSILGHMGIVKDRKVTVFPGFERDMFDAQLDEVYVVRDGNLVTARGMGVSTEFALELLALLKGQATADKIRASIQCR